jgi:hypothetical protein
MSIMDFDALGLDPLWFVWYLRVEPKRAERPNVIVREALRLVLYSTGGVHMSRIHDETALPPAARKQSNKSATGNEQSSKRDNESGQSARQSQHIIKSGLTEFVEHDNGFLKVRRALDSDTLHLTWTWSVGKHAGTYVYVAVEYWQLDYGLTLLLAKVFQAELGVRKTTPDKLGHSYNPD